MIEFSTDQNEISLCKIGGVIGKNRGQSGGQGELVLSE